MNADPIRVLNLEADPMEHERVRRQAESTGLSLGFSRASSRAEFEAALRRGGVDLILADHCIPGYDGFAALEFARALFPRVPYIIVSESTGEDWAVECIRRGASDFVHKKRLERLAAAIVRAMSAAGGSPPGMDGEELKPLGTDLLRRREIELAGRLVGTIAHDFNNLLTVISGYACTLLDRESLSPADSEALKRVFTASKKATGLVRQLLHFRRSRNPAMEIVDLNAEADVVARELRQLLGDSAVVEFKPSPESPRASADPAMLEQMLTSLATNARGVRPRGGRISIAVGVGQAGREAERGGGPGRVAGHAFLTLRDTAIGGGAPESPQLPKPLLAATDEGGGEGLALVVAKDIARLHGGWIEVTTEKGMGTEFRICLPRAGDGIAPAAPPVPGLAPKAARGALILLVEDELSVREFAAAVLQLDGHRILQARSGENALEVWRWHSARIDLLLTDVVLPGELSGPQLGLRLQREKPSLKVILTTGLDHEMAAAQAASGPPGRVLLKPYSPRTLLQAAREALA